MLVSYTHSAPGTPISPYYSHSGSGSNDEIDELADDEEAEYGDDYEVIDDSLGPTQLTLLSPENKVKHIILSAM